MYKQTKSLHALSDSHFDVVIIGGGMVGASLAAGFVQQGKRVLIVEQHQPNKAWLDVNPLRVSAVNRFSENWLQSVGCWLPIADKYKCQFNRLATWERGAPRVEFTAEELDEHHLGFLVRNEALQLACYDAMASAPEDNLSYLFGVTIEAILSGDTTVQITCSDMSGTEPQQITLSASLLVGADGANSRCRTLSNIGISGWDYAQQCFSITIKTEFSQQDITWQEFQPSGPKAFLPLNDGYASLIWYDSKITVNELTSLTNDKLKDRILSTFPSLPGDFSIVQTASFPLTRRQANTYNQSRVVLVGDAAHTINPLAGQGVNLGYKDNATLLDLLSEFSPSDLNDTIRLYSSLDKYTRLRKADSLVMSTAMDGFYHLFSNDKPLVKSVRQAMLSVANMVPFAKKQIIKKALGF